MTCSSPAKMIVGYFTFSNIVEDTPENLWKTFQKVGGINKDDFFEYYKETEKGFGIVIKEVVKFEVEKDPIEFIEDFTAPQSYVYLERDLLKI